MMDIDNFKSFNDNYGHLTGDEVVVNVGRCIKNTIRNYDRAGRFGGDEFMIVLPETSLDEAGVVAEKIKESITGKLMVIKENSLKVTVSIGVSSLIDNEKFITGKIGIKSLRDIYEIKDKRKADWERINGLKRMAAGLLVESADIALYKAKEGGRDRIELFER
jgi:diguanylate cyclase (GGDEF)-like protein